MAALLAAAGLSSLHAGSGTKGQAFAAGGRNFHSGDLSIARLRALLASGEISAAALTRAYLHRIRRLDRRGPAINSVIELNPEAGTIAREIDSAGVASRPGLLRGIPILIKDNIETGDRMMTTAGSLALAGQSAGRDAFVVERLRQAGAVILGKTNLSEWANFRSGDSTSGWSARGGLTKNPHVLDRNTSGSSSGSAAAVAAGLCAAAIGTETDGSIISPASYCGIVGLKPTVGLVSRTGIIPISKTQDTAGPMTRSVRDAAIVLSAMTGVDPRDEATLASEGKAWPDYSAALRADGLQGARIGVVREFFRSVHDDAQKVMEQALAAMKRAGAVLIDPVELPGFRTLGRAEYQIMLYEFKAGLNAYLASRQDDIKVRSLAELIRFNEAHGDTELRYFGQEHLVRAEAKGPLTEPEYLEAVALCRRVAREEGIDAVMNEHRLDAIVAPSGGPAHRTDRVHGDRNTGGSSSLAAISGYPSITVPAGQVSGLPVGISFVGQEWGEAGLLKLAYGFEKTSPARLRPRFLATLDGGTLRVD